MFFIVEQQKGRNSKKGKKKKKTRPHGREIALEQANQNLCGGFYKVSSFSERQTYDGYSALNTQNARLSPMYMNSESCV